MSPVVEERARGRRRRLGRDLVGRLPVLARRRLFTASLVAAVMLLVIAGCFGAGIRWATVAAATRTAHPAGTTRSVGTSAREPGTTSRPGWWMLTDLGVAAAPSRGGPSRRSRQGEAAAPRRVLLVGDSLMFGAYPALATILDSHHVQTHFVGFPGTGLLSKQGWWLRDISREVATFDPGVVVIEACCNYANREALYDLRGRPVLPDTPTMFTAWEASARDAVARARVRGARVYWAITPDAAILVTENFQVRIHLFNAIYARLGVPLIDWRRAVEPRGVYTVSMPTPFGDVPVRRSDGLHLTGAGDYEVAQATWAAIRPAFGSTMSRGSSRP